MIPESLQRPLLPGAYLLHDTCTGNMTNPAHARQLSRVAIALFLMVCSVGGPGCALSFVLTVPRQHSHARTPSGMSFSRHHRCGGGRLGCSRRYGDVGVRGKRCPVGGVAIAMSTIDEAEAIAARAAAKVNIYTSAHGYERHMRVEIEVLGQSLTVQ